MKDINVRDDFSQLHMELHCVQKCAVEDLLVLQHAWLTSSYVAQFDLLTCRETSL